MRDRPRLHELVEGAQRLLQRGVLVVEVRVVEVDPVGPQALERGPASRSIVSARRLRTAPLPPPTLVAITSSSRLPRSAIQRPMIVSEPPCSTR